MALLRAGLLSGRNVVLAGDVPADVRSALGELGASLAEVPPGELSDDEALETVASVSPVYGLVVATGGFDGAAGGRLESALDSTWTVVRAVAAGALIPQGAGGKIVLLAPPPGAGEYTEALRAALENLARTLSIEWARHGVSVSAITPGAGTTAAQTATLVGFLLSPAGDYFSGCRLSLGV
jgi:NAD(P)-dependent dehydrogenase (short-subunit alcohol dehydrogenase family)